LRSAPFLFLRQGLPWQASAILVVEQGRHCICSCAALRNKRRRRAKKSRPGDRANDTLFQRIGAFGQSNRVSGNGTTLLLAITPAQRVGWAGVKATPGQSLACVQKT
jgi:hypothetical protein